MSKDLILECEDCGKELLRVENADREVTGYHVRCDECDHGEKEFSTLGSKMSNKNKDKNLSELSPRPGNRLKAGEPEAEAVFGNLEQRFQELPFSEKSEMKEEMKQRMTKLHDRDTMPKKFYEVQADEARAVELDEEKWEKEGQIHFEGRKVAEAKQRE